VLLAQPNNFSLDSASKEGKSSLSTLPRTSYADALGNEEIFGYSPSAGGERRSYGQDDQSESHSHQSENSGIQEFVEDTRPPAFVDIVREIERLAIPRTKTTVKEESKLLPWQLNKGTVDSLPRVAVPKQHGNSEVEALAYLLVDSLSDELGIVMIENENVISIGDLPAEITKYADGITLAVLKSKEITSGSFGSRSSPLDLGYTAAIASCCIHYCQEAGANRGQFLTMIPEGLRGTKEIKKSTTEWFGKLRSMLTKDEYGQRLLNTLIWLFNKWALKHSSTIGRRVMRSQKIRWEIVKINAIPHQTRMKKERGKVTYYTNFSSPKNIGSSPLISTTEKTVLRTLSQLGYTNVLEETENKWKSCTAELQHSIFDDTVAKIKSLYLRHSEASARIVSRQYKRRKYFEKEAGMQPPSTKKNKPLDPKVLSKHLSDLSKKVFSSQAIKSKIPLATSSMALIINTYLEEVLDNCLAKRDTLVEAVGKEKSVILAKEMRAFKDSWNLLKQKEPQEVLRFEATNQYGLLAEDDDDDGT
jgi:hypothetical protein